MILAHVDLNGVWQTVDGDGINTGNTQEKLVCVC